MKSLIQILSILFILISFLPAQNTWEWQHPLPQGNSLTNIQTFGQDSIVSVGMWGTLIESYNGGIDWQCNFEYVGSRYISDAHFINSNIGWTVGDSGRVHKTIDGGLSWTAYEVNDTTLYSRYNAVFFIDELTGWVAGNSDNISKTTDGGVTWTHYPLTGFSKIINTIYFINDLIGWATSSSSTIYYTFDGGLTWYVQPGVGFSTINDIYFLNDTLGWAVGSVETIIRTVDGGANWTEVQSFVDWYNLNQVYFWDEYNGIAVGDAGKMLKSNDGGISWTYFDIGKNTDLKSISTEDSSNIWIVGRSGLILHSNDLGITWNELSNMVTYNVLNQVQFVDENTGWAAGGSIIKSTDGGDTWTNLDTLNHNISALHAIDAQTCFFIESQWGYLLRTFDGGSTFDTLQIPGGIPPFDQFQFIDANTGWVLDAVDSVFKTIDGGQNWTVVSTDDSSSYFGQDIFFSDSNNGWIAGTNGTIMHTSDGGANWISQNSGVNNHLYSIKFVDANTGWAGGYDILLKTTDGGSSWNIISNTNTPSVYDLEVIDSNTLWVLGNLDSYTSPWQSTDGGNTWQMEEIPSIAATDMFFLNNQTGWVVTTQGGIIKRTGTPNYVDNESLNELPAGFVLQQNYPNPFNPKTKIQYQITQNVEVTLEIFNILGQRIKTLVNTYQQAGEYAVEWDGSNMASSVYYYRLKAGEFVQTKKMMLLQ